MPSPAQGRPIVSLPALAAAKLGAYRAMRAAGLNKNQLAGRPGWQPLTGDAPAQWPLRLAPRPDQGGPCCARPPPSGDKCSTLTSARSRIAQGAEWDLRKIGKRATPGSLCYFPIQRDELGSTLRSYPRTWESPSERPKCNDSK